MNSHYRTLGVEPEADPLAIRSAYLALMRRYHPDRGGDEADPARAQAVTAAWEVLRDPARRAAYDETRKAHFQPGGAIVRGARVRGGATGRNLFLLLAAATVGLGWWAFQQPPLVPPVKQATLAARPAPRLGEPEIRPEADRQAMHRRIEVNEEPRYRGERRAPAVADEVALAPPVAEPARMESPSAEVRQQRARETRRERPETAPPRPKTGIRTASVAPLRAAPQVDLAPLERHLQILTDQSLRFGTAAKRTRLLATRETFAAQLRSCDDDACKRDAYLRRNAEVGEIMQNR